MADDVQALVAAVDAAEAAKQALLDERRGNRTSMTKAAFSAYNTETHAKQRDVQAAVDAATAALQAALNNNRQEVLVTALEGRETLGGAT
jgi:hypothetical protein